MRFTTLPREIMLRRTEDTPKLPENYPKRWETLTKKIKQTPSKKAQSLADLGKREKEFTANIDLIKKFNPRLKNDRLTLPSPLKQTLIKKSSCQSNSCTYENHQGYQIVFTKNKAGQLVAHIKDKISQGTIVDKKTGKSAKEIPVMVDEGIKDPIAFLIESTHREDTYRACFYPGYESQDPTVVIGFSAAGLRGGVSPAAVIAIVKIAVKIGLTLGDLKGRVRHLERNVNQLANSVQDLANTVLHINQNLQNLESRVERQESYNYRQGIMGIRENLDRLGVWCQRIFTELQNPELKVTELVQKVLNDTLYKIIPEMGADCHPGEAYIIIKHVVERFTDLLTIINPNSPQQIDDICKLTRQSASCVIRVINMIYLTRVLINDLVKNGLPRDVGLNLKKQCKRNIINLQKKVNELRAIAGRYSSK